MVLGFLSVLLVAGLVSWCLRRYRSAPARWVAVVAAVVLLLPLNLITLADEQVLGPDGVLVAGVVALAIAALGFVAAERLRVG